jgi:hypothetical protein
MVFENIVKWANKPGRNEGQDRKRWEDARDEWVRCHSNK